MPYIANHELRHAGKSYHKGDIVSLTFDEALDFVKHGAITKQRKAAGAKPESAKASASKPNGKNEP